MLKGEVKLLLEKKFGRAIRYPKDCEELAQIMRKDHGLTISASTLKRLWGFYKETETPRLYSLDTLARFFGVENWDQIQSNQVINPEKMEDLVLIQVPMLRADDTLVIEYSSSCKLLLKYRGDFLFQVLESTTSKILAGDILQIFNIVKKYPLICHSVLRENVELGKYIGSKNGGVTYICVINNTTK